MRQARRTFLCQSALAGAALVAGALAPGRTRAASRGELAMYGPPAGPSVILAHLAESDGLAETAMKIRFETYRNPDLLRTGFASGPWELAVAPSYVAANLYNKGVPVRLLNIMTWGLLYVVSTDADVSGLEDLRGETLAMPFKGDMPDLVFRHLARSRGMQVGSDYRLNYVADPFQGVQMLLSGRVSHAVLPEPAATASLLRGRKAGHRLVRALSLQESWGEATNGPAAIPQAGTVVRESLLQDLPELPAKLNAAIARSTEWVVDNPADAGRLAAAYLGVQAPVIERSIPHSNFRLRGAADAREEIERFYSVLAEASPAIIGGKLPDASFYIA